MGCTTSTPAAQPPPVVCTLTSSAIAKTENDVYKDEETEWLLPHEPIRQEFLRVEHALMHFDLVNCPWHIFVLHTWLSEYFFRAVHFHHDNEEKIVGPYWQKLGETTDFGKTAGHAEIVSMMDSFGAYVKAVKDYVVDAGKTTPASELKAKQAELQTKWAAFQSLMFVHLAEEEVFWPQVYARHDKKHAKAVVDLILAADFKLKGKDAVAGHAFAGAVMDCVGPFKARYGKYKYSPPSHALDMGPWCAREVGEKFMRQIPFVPRALILPSFHKEYILKWRVLIESIGGTVNPLST